MISAAPWKKPASATLGVFVLLTGSMLLSEDYHPPPEVALRPKIVTLRSHHQVKHLFSSLNYNWETAEEFAPSLLLTSLPHDLDRVPTVAEKKRLFFLSMLPAALLANQEIALQRKRLLELCRRLDQGEPLDREEQEFLLRLSRQYKVSGTPLESAQERTELLNRVDIIPPALILAQAACESGYGTSRFSKLANNLFGEWSFTPGTGLVPEERPEGAYYEVRRFNSLYESVQSYLNNLNTHFAYDALRGIRSQLRSQGAAITGVTLAEGLRLYSVARERYVADIKNIIQKNRLSRFSQTQLLFLTFKG
ncbi:MAG: glucosaminidase domain-containing protein [Deltaproteobacteria bacterium]|nr:glucosaminidase domain-containing protein [Deltaproteobacteria bacterium]